MKTLERSRVHVPQQGLLLPGYGLVKPALHEAKRVIGHKLSGEEIYGISGAAWTVSGLYVANHIDVYDATQLAIDLSLTSHKWAMYDNSNTPNFSSDVSYAATNEVVGTGYTAGGRTISAGGGSPTLTESPTGTMMYDQNDMLWAAPTTITAYGAKMYADALAADNLVVACYFGGAVTSTAGTFTIQFATLGVFTVDWTP